MLRLFLCFLISTSLFSFSFDKKYPENDSFLYTSHYPIPYLMSYSLVAYSLLNGITTRDDASSSRFHKASSKALEALFITQVATDTIKLIAGRKRPRNAQTPYEWGHFGHKSFLSGHVSSATSIVTSYILEYKDDYPAVYLLALIPIHQMVGRVNAQAHWTSDVVAGALLGFFVAKNKFYSNDNIMLYFNDDKKYIGFKYTL